MIDIVEHKCIDDQNMNRNINENINKLCDDSNFDQKTTIKRINRNKLKNILLIKNRIKNLNKNILENIKMETIKNTELEEDNTSKLIKTDLKLKNNLNI